MWTIKNGKLMLAEEAKKIATKANAARVKAISKAEKEAGEAAK